MRIGKRVGHRFRNTDHLVLALTHVSAGGGEGNYERLEFLGDRVLGLIVAGMLFEEFPDADEGELSRRYNALVNAETLAAVADEIDLHEFVIAGAEMKTLRGRKRVNLRADVVESLIAAIFLDGGLAAAGRFVERHWRERARASGGARRDPKTELQEWAHRVHAAAPVYVTETRAGPDHDPVFTVRVTVAGFAPGTGTGRSKREAEQNAATAVLSREGVWTEEGA
jgi:ribonuclease-3